MESNYYNLLGIETNSTVNEIKKAYRKMSLDCHPDRNNNDLAKSNLFKKISEAYEILSDPDKRKNYDQTIKLSNLNNFNNIDNFNNFNNIDNCNNIENILKSQLFTNLFTNLNHFDNFYNQNIPLIEKSIEISLEQSYSGISIPIIIDKWRLENNNKIDFKETLYLDLDPGIDHGEVIFFKNKGNFLNKDLIGDIQVIVKIKNHNLFYRNGLDLYYDKNITFKQSFCGFSFDLLFLNGKEYKINNKEGNIIYPGFQKIVNEFGMKRNNKIGNLFIKFNIEFPKNITESQIKFINENF